MNTVVVRGRVRATPVERRLASGELIVTFDLETPAETGRVHVPVVWSGDSRCTVRAGDELVVVGSVERRFFRVGGTTAWRTDVVASQVIGPGASRAVRRHLEQVATAVLGLARMGRVRSRPRPRRVDDSM